MKSEPDVFSFDDLKAEKDQTTYWDGIRNYQARNFMRDEMSIGDPVLYYHSRVQPMGVAGIAKVASKAYPDHTQFDPKSDYHDPKSKKEDPRWLMVDVAFAADLPTDVTLEELKANDDLADMKVVQRGMRLSIQPVTPEEFRIVCRMGGLADAKIDSLLA